MLLCFVLFSPQNTVRLKFEHVTWQNLRTYVENQSHRCGQFTISWVQVTLDSLLFKSKCKSTSYRINLTSPSSGLEYSTLNHNFNLYCNQIMSFKKEKKELNSKTVVVAIWIKKKKKSKSATTLRRGKLWEEKIARIGRREVILTRKPHISVFTVAVNWNPMN